MAALVQSVQAAFTSVPHEAPKITHNRKIALAITSATIRMPDHQSGYFWGELLHPYEVFTAQGWDVDVVSENGQATVDEASVTAMASGGDKAKWEDKKFPLHAKLAAIQPASSITAASYAAIYFAGGHACCVDLPTAAGLKKLTADIYEAGGIVGADCHGIAVFEQLRLSNGTSLLQGKRVTGFSTKGEEEMKVMDWMRSHGFKTMQEHVQTNGGEWHESSSGPMSEYTETSDRVCTGMNPASAAAVAQNMLQLLPSAADAKA